MHVFMGIRVLWYECVFVNVYTCIHSLPPSPRLPPFLSFFLFNNMVDRKSEKKKRLTLNSNDSYLNLILTSIIHIIF